MSRANHMRPGILLPFSAPDRCFFVVASGVRKSRMCCQIPSALMAPAVTVLSEVATPECALTGGPEATASTMTVAATSLGATRPTRAACMDPIQHQLTQNVNR